ncbi:MAG: choice-of-anchor tandem repeat GloVer-containing protein [Bacteroidia bacterium]
MKNTYRTLFALSFLVMLPEFSVAQEFWGMTSSGGAYGLGTIFKADSGCTNAVAKYSFVSNIPGSNPSGDLVQASNGKFYGMTTNGGTNGTGVLFEYDATGGIYTRKFEFIGTTTGANPVGSLIQAGNGKLYGMTSSGGTGNIGVLFSFDPVSSAFVKLIDFYGANGSMPTGSLMQASTGKLYGLTSAGGGNGKGILFSYDPVTTTFMDKFDFSGTADGAGPQGSLIQAMNGKLYGLTTYGGIKNAGALFQFDTLSGALSKLADFDTIPTGCNPTGSLVEISHGKLFGTASYGGVNTNGTIFSYVISTGIFSKVADFNVATLGGTPNGSMVLAPNGKFYGLTFAGGTNGIGTLFQLDTTTLTLVNKVNLSGSANGSNPKGSPILATDGKLYGMDYNGGLNNSGVLFQYDPGTSTYTDKVDFETAVNGAVPTGNLYMATNGKFYGMTTAGGTNGTGALFEFDTATSVLTSKVQFTGANGTSPNGSLMQASNGKLYGVTTGGGTSNSGILFEYDPASSTYTKKYDFDGAGNGGAPFCTLLQASDGLIYGVATTGGANSAGVLYSFDPASSTYTKTFDFNTSIDGGSPYGALIQTSPGRLFGLTAGGGNNGTGILYEYSISSAACTKRVDFVGTTNGTNPYGALVSMPGGKLYGTTSGGGANGLGVIFEYDTASGTLTKVLPLTAQPNGNFPQGSIIVAGNQLFLTTVNGGVNNIGALVEYDPVSNTAVNKSDFVRTSTGADPYGDLVYFCNPVAVSANSGDTAKCQGNTSILWVTTTGKYVTYQWYKNGVAIGGATGSKYIIPNMSASDSAFYYCNVQNACGNLNSLQVHITLNAQPSVPTITQNGAVLTSSSVTGNQWYLNGVIITGATAQNYTPSANGNYTVTVTNSSGCSATSAPFNMTNTGITEKAGELIMQVFPNPATTTLNLSFQVEQETQTELSVMDLLGNTVLNSRAYLTKSANKTVLDISILNPGMYVLKVSSISGQGLIKFFKQ